MCPYLLRVIAVNRDSLERDIGPEVLVPLTLFEIKVMAICIGGHTETTALRFFAVIMESLNNAVIISYTFMRHSLTNFIVDQFVAMEYGQETEQRR